MRIYCSICKDILIPYAEVQVTNCGHLYHASCIGTWLKQNKTCPQCRASLSKPYRVYFDVEKDSEADVSTLEQRLEITSDKLRETERHEKELIEKNKNLIKVVKHMRVFASSVSTKNNQLKASLDVLKEEVARLSRKKEAYEELESALEKSKTKIKTLERIETLINSSVDETNKLLESTPVSSLSVKNLCTYISVLKVQLNKAECRSNALIKENKELLRELDKQREKPFNESEEIVKNLKAENGKLKSDVQSLHLLANYYKNKYARKCQQLAPPHSSTAKILAKRNFDEINLDTLEEELNKTVKKEEVPSSSSVHPQKSIPSESEPLETDENFRHWYELLTAGPVYNLGLRSSRTFNKALSNKDGASTSRSSEQYAFDGFGGTKKIRLGGPTPAVEFERIKRKKKGENRGEDTFHLKKIDDYFNIDI